MSKQYSPMDMQGNPIVNFALEYLTTQPNGMVRGRIYFSSTLGPAYYDGTTVRPLDAKYLTDGSIALSALALDPLARVNHTGTQLSATISDLKTTVTGYRLNEFAAPNGPVAFGNQRLTGVGVATQDTDAPTFGQIKTLISQAIAGQTARKNPARVAADANQALSGLRTIDGYSLSAGDRILLTAQTTGSQNGLYTVASGAWTRAVDADEPTEWIEGTEILILSGTNYGGTVWRQTTPGTITVGTTTMNFTMVQKVNTYSADNITLTLTGMTFAVKLKPSGGLVSDATGISLDTTIICRKGIASLTSDGSTTTYNVAHNFNNVRPQVQFFDDAGIPVGLDWTVVDANTIRAVFGAASIPASGKVFQVAIVG